MIPPKSPPLVVSLPLVEIFGSCFVACSDPVACYPCPSRSCKTTFVHRRECVCVALLESRLRQCVRLGLLDRREGSYTFQKVHVSGLAITWSSKQHASYVR